MSSTLLSEGNAERTDDGSNSLIEVSEASGAKKKGILRRIYRKVFKKGPIEQSSPIVEEDDGKGKQKS